MRNALVSLFAVAAFASSAAIAAPQVTIDFNNPIWGSGVNRIDPILATIHFAGKGQTAPNQSSRVNAGRFVGRASEFQEVSSEIFYRNEDQVYMYCYDVHNTILSGESVRYTIDFNGAVQRTLQFIDAVNRVLSVGDTYNPYAWVTPTTSLQAGAIQLGLWESLYDTDWSLTDSAGKFYATNVTAGVVDQANAFFREIGDSAIDQKFTMVLRHPGRQDMITADPPNAVPAPATLLLVLPAIAGLMLGVRRRRVV